MKPPAFDYIAPTSVAEVLAELARHDGEARPLAGGQSLIPMLNFRLLAPKVLVDLRRIAALSSVSFGAVHVSVGSMTRTARLLEPDIEKACPVLANAARLVAHPQIRSRGTVGGSISHADPAAELPAVALLTGASLRLAGIAGERTVPANGYFLGMFTTACAWNEILIGIDFPTAADRSGWGFREYARRPGDFAVAGVGAILKLANETISSIAIVTFGVGPRPMRASGAEEACLNKLPAPSTLQEARRVFEEEIVLDDSAFASSDYKRRVAGVLFEQVLNDALTRSRKAIV